MSVSLVKGGNISLEKEAPGVKNILIGLGWDVRTTDGEDFDLDASVFLLTKQGKVRSEADFIFYNQKQSSDGSVIHSGDNRTGEGEGDDETIRVFLDKVPADIERIAVTVTIYEAEARNQNFGQVRNAFARVCNLDEPVGSDFKEICRYDLSEDASLCTAMIFAEVYRKNGEWKVKAVGDGFKGGLKALCESFGVHLG